MNFYLNLKVKTVLLCWGSNPGMQQQPELEHGVAHRDSTNALGRETTVEIVPRQSLISLTFFFLLLLNKACAGAFFFFSMPGKLDCGLNTIVPGKVPGSEFPGSHQRYISRPLGMHLVELREIKSIFGMESGSAVCQASTLNPLVPTSLLIRDL